MKFFGYGKRIWTNKKYITTSEDNIHRKKYLNMGVNYLPSLTEANFLLEPSSRSI